jgi:SepF-like predicted cell division protein (DUF552 family)
MTDTPPLQAESRPDAEVIEQCERLVGKEVDAQIARVGRLVVLPVAEQVA